MHEVHPPGAGGAPRTISNYKDPLFINTQSVSLGNTEEENDKNLPEIQTDGQTEFKNIQNYIDKITDIGDLRRISSEEDKQIIEEIRLNILEMYISKSISIKGEKKPQEVIRAAIARLSYWHIQSLVNKYKALTIKIKNKKSYMQTMIYNIAFENDLEITNQVQHDLYN